MSVTDPIFLKRLLKVSITNPYTIRDNLSDHELVPALSVYT
jgi:hypothetical protein